MAPLPKRRHSTRRGGKRKAAIASPTTTITSCKNCGASIVPHRVCNACGYYGGKAIIQMQTIK